MNISSGQKLAILGVLLVGGGAAFVYLDPMELDLLGLNPPPVVVQTPTPRPPPPKMTPAPPPAMPATPSAPVKADQPALAKVAEPPAAPAAPAVSTQPEVLPENKTSNVKPLSPPSVDLRHCLDLTTDEAVMKCAVQ